MNDATTAALERLLDAELATVLGRRATPAIRTRARTPWLVAALVLLGLAVVGTVAALRPATRTMQEPGPAPMPEAVHADTLAELDALPATTVNLVCKLGQPDQFTRLSRFGQLRRLTFQIAEVKYRGRVVVAAHRDWDATEADVFAPLAALPLLEELHVPGRFRLRPEHLTALRTAPRLRELGLALDAGRIDAPLAAALASLPKLTALRLIQSPLDATQARHLTRIPLTSLSLWENAGVDDDVIAAVAGHPHLARLELHGFGPAPIDAHGPRTWTPSPKAMARLAAMPKLRELALDGCEVDDELLAALPANLQALSLYSTSGYTADGLRSLRRLGSLRTFQFRERFGYLLFDQHRIAPVAAAAALAEMLSTLRLHEFRFTGHPTAELLAALVQQPDLHTLAFFEAPEQVGPPLPDLEVVARMPSLRTLSLGNLALPADALQPLASARALRRLQLSYCGELTSESVAAALPGVEVEVRTFADWQKK